MTLPPGATSSTARPAGFLVQRKPLMSMALVEKVVFFGKRGFCFVCVCMFWFLCFLVFFGRKLAQKKRSSLILDSLTWSTFRIFLVNKDFWKEPLLSGYGVHKSLQIKER